MKEDIEVKMNAARVCYAISKIGYRPSSAIMDIVDNSVTAEATSIFINLELDPDKTLAKKDNVLSYTIIDNGKGMSDKEIINSLKLGSDAFYDARSLSKYGMGLKSAGLSLGNKISIASKKNGVLSHLYYLDFEALEESYKITKDSVSKIGNELHQTLESFDSGTIVLIEKCQNRNSLSAKKTIAELTDRLGVTYNGFIQNKKLDLQVKYSGLKKPIEVQGLDILFENIATKGFDPDKYEGKLPCKVLDETVKLTQTGEEELARLKVVIFPQVQMSKNKDLTAEEKAQIKSYKIARENSGFFIYRNGRLVRWGDKLDGIVSRDLIGFRASLEINTSHDEVLKVDVSKQRLDIPDEILDKLEVLVRQAKKDSDEAFKRCAAMCKDDLSEGEKFNERNQFIAEEDPEESSFTNKDREEERKRKKKNIELTQEELEKSDEAKVPAENSQATDGETTPPEQVYHFEKIRYSDKVSSQNLWEAHRDPSEGVFVRINKNHPLYSTILADFPSYSAARQTIEAIIWSLAASEILSCENITDLSDDQIRKVLDKFKRLTSWNLSTWTLSNQDLGSDD